MRTLAIPLGWLLLWGAGCGGGTSGADAGTMAQAEADFWSAFLSGNVGAVPAARDEMLAAFAPDSGDYLAARFIGMSDMLTFASAGGPPPGRGPPADGGSATLPPQALALVEGAVQYTTLAADAAPQALRYIDLGHEGDALYTLGKVTQQPAVVAQARAMLGQAIGADPIYGNIAQAPVLLAQPTASPDFGEGLDSLLQYFQDCTGAPVDLHHPDLSAMLGATRGPDCGNGMPHVPHNLEGVLLLFGDNLVKAGDASAARAVYQTATQTPDYAAWSYRSVVESRLGSDLEALADAGTLPPGSSACLHCHQQ